MVCDANSTPPFLFQMPPCKGRKVLEEAQSTPVHMYPAVIRDIIVNTGEWGKIPVYIVCPDHMTSPANVIFYIYGAGVDASVAWINRKNKMDGDCRHRGI